MKNLFIKKYKILTNILFFVEDIFTNEITTFG